MSAKRLDSHYLLEYNAKHRVLICRECQYAIQKSALPSHLLRHKIYRGERQSLLSSIAKLDLADCQDVVLPTPASPPIDGLPIISGYRCIAAACANLCASSKRMRRHWSESHGLSESVPMSSLAHVVKLQTFFRGTQIRYFEVSSSAAANKDGKMPKNPTDYDIWPHDRTCGTETAMPPPAPSPSLATSISDMVNLDLKTMEYFHHFVTNTTFTLSSVQLPQFAPTCWETSVIRQALEQKWLMCGVLAISAYHLAALAEDASVGRIHLERSMQYLSEFFAGCEETTMTTTGVIMACPKVEVNRAAARIRSVLRLAYRAVTESTCNQGIAWEMTIPLDLETFLTAIRDLSDFALPASGVPGGQDDDIVQEKLYSRAKVILNAGSSSSAADYSESPSEQNTPSTITSKLRALPSRMTEVFGKPENAQEVIVTLFAVASLVECCDISFASDEAGTAWHGMAAWLMKIPHYFNNMVSHNSLPAFVVLAHWVGLLVRRAENCGCWFLRSSSDMLLLEIFGKIPPHRHAVRSLVEELLPQVQSL